MGVPKSVTKIKRGNVEYISSVDRVSYTLNELTRAALRDTGKFVCNRFRSSFYQNFRRRTGKVGRFTQYWVRRRDADLQVGLKPNAFYGGIQEVGSRTTPKLRLLRSSVEENIPKIIEIQSQYLSALEDEARALSLIDEGEMEGS